MSQYENERDGDHYETPHFETQHVDVEHASTQHVDSDSDGKAFRLYMAALDRTPDSSGLATWMAAINRGEDLEHVASGFVNSSEFQAKYGSLSHGEYVRQLYNNVLERDPDLEGQKNWVNALNAGETREHVLIGFSESTENQSQAAALVNGVDFQAWVG